MKKVLIFLFGALTIAASGCRDKAETQQAQLLRLQAQQDSIRRADEERILALQIKAREDSIAMSSVVTDYSSAYSSPQYSAYYVVVGSFLNKSNANAYLRSMQNTFGKAQIVNSGRWNFVCVGGQFDSFSSARATLSNVKSQRVNGGGGGSSSSRVAAADDDEDEGGDDDEESYDEEEDEGGDEEDEGGDEEGEGEEDTGDEEDYGSSSSGESVGQAWVLGI